MLLGIYAVFDKATGAYAQPFFQSAKGAAIRAFMDACNNPESMVSRHPTDYALFQLGVFDDASGSITSEEVPEKIITATEIVNPKRTAKNAKSSRNG